MILALEEAKYRLENFRADIKELGSALRIDDLRQKVKDLEATTSDAAFWNDQETSGKTLREIKRLKDKIQKFEALSAKLEDTITLAELAIEENDESLIEEVETAEKRSAKTRRPSASRSCSPANTTRTTRSSPSIRAQAGPRRRTGPRCCTACTPAGASVTATTSS